jgi:DGQHR domain-containing protein
MTKKDYSANAKLEEWAKKLDFSLKIFDIGDGTGIKNKDTGCDIDAILYYRNIIILIEVYGGKNKQEAEDKMKKFHLGLKNVDKIEDIIRSLNITAGSKANEDKAKKDLDKIYSAIKKKQKDRYGICVKKLFFSPELDIDSEVKDTYQAKDLFIFDKEVSHYLEQVHSTLGKEFLLRDVMSFINISKILLSKNHSSSSGEPAQNRPIEVSRLELKKGKMVMYSCSCLVSELQELITVFRPIGKKHDMAGFQRMLKKERIEKIIGGYLKSNETFPNNIIIALEPKLYREENDFIVNNNKFKLKLYDEYNSLFIIDGQHRFFSLLKSGGDKNVLVTFVFYKDKTEKAILKMYETFYEINKKQERIDASLSFVLKAKIDKDSDESFWFDVLKKLNLSSGFFKNRVSFKEKQLRYKDEKNILSVITYGGLLKLNNKVKNVEGLSYFHKGKPQDDKKFASNLLNNYFSIVQDELGKIGKSKNDVTPREIGALIRLIRHFMIKDREGLQTLGNNVNLTGLTGLPKKHADRVRDIIGAIKFVDVFNSTLSSSNWAAVEGLLVKDIHAVDPSFGSKDLLSKKGIESYNS